jgi:two-component system sensor histidine kinase BaeS
MKSLLSKILISLLVSVVIALAVVMGMTRINLQSGLIDYIERQEASQLEILVPELTELYQQKGSWDFLRGFPWRWKRLIRITRQGDSTGRAEEELPGAERLATPPGKHRPPARDHRQLRSRLFLLDENKVRVAGAVIMTDEPLPMEAIEVDGALVGWLGFIPVRAALPPEAKRFLHGQARTLMVSLVIALLLAAALGFLLARHLSRPVQQLASAVGALRRGDYSVRAPISTGDEIGALGRDVNQLAETLEKNQTARRRWMADIAHELRTPVAILMGEIEALQDGVRQTDKKSADSLHEEAEQLSRLIDDLQTLALSDAGALDFRLEPVRLSELVKQTGESFRDRLQARGIELDLRIQNDLSIDGDHQRLRQLLQNLLENSCRYVDPKGQVILSLAGAGGKTELSLDDSGPGLEPDQLSRLFERFYRVEGSRSRAGGGSGLGLSICRNIVEAHQGSISAQSSNLGGLRIQVTLPG